MRLLSPCSDDSIIFGVIVSKLMCRYHNIHIVHALYGKLMSL